jgi:hypothetical protein
MSAPVRSSHSGPLSSGRSLASGGLEVTGEDNAVDGWWTCDMLSRPRTVGRCVFLRSTALPTWEVPASHRHDGPSNRQNERRTPKGAAKRYCFP